MAASSSHQPPPSKSPEEIPPDTAADANANPAAAGTSSGPNEESVCDFSELKSSGRIHWRLASGRYVTVLLRKTGTEEVFCIDSNCYHMGGPLGIGDIEDIRAPSGPKSGSVHDVGQKFESGSPQHAARSPRAGTSGSVLRTATASEKNRSAGSSSATAGHRSGSSAAKSSLGNGSANVVKESETSGSSAAAAGSAGANVADAPADPDPVIVCPWHHHKVSLRTGKKYTQAVKPVVHPGTGKVTMEPCGLQQSTTACQQVHRVFRRDGRVYVVETGAQSKDESGAAGEADFPLAGPNPYATDPHCAKNLRPSMKQRLHSFLSGSWFKRDGSTTRGEEEEQEDFVSTKRPRLGE